MSDATTATRFRLTSDPLADGHEDEFAMYKFIKNGPKHITQAAGGNLRLNGATITETQGNTARRLMESEGLTDIGQVIRMLLDQAANG